MSKIHVHRLSFVRVRQDILELVLNLVAEENQSISIQNRRLKESAGVARNHNQSFFSEERREKREAPRDKAREKQLQISSQLIIAPHRRTNHS